MNVNIFESHTSVNILCDASMFSAWLVCLFMLRNSDQRQNVPTSRETLISHPAGWFWLCHHAQGHLTINGPWA